MAKFRLYWVDSTETEVEAENFTEVIKSLSGKIKVPLMGWDRVFESKEDLVETLQASLDTLSDESLDKTISFLREEKMRRIEDNIVGGKYPPPSLEVCELLFNGKKVEAIKKYYKENDCPLVVAKKIIERVSNNNQ